MTVFLALIPFFLCLTLHAQEKPLELPPLTNPPPLFGDKQVFQETLEEALKLQAFDTQESVRLIEKKFYTTCSIHIDEIPKDFDHYLKNHQKIIGSPCIRITQDLNEKIANISLICDFFQNSATYTESIVRALKKYISTFKNYKEKKPYEFCLNNKEYELTIAALNNNFLKGRTITKHISPLLQKKFDSASKELIILEKLYNLTYYNTILGVIIASKNHFNAFLQLQEAGFPLEKAPDFLPFGITFKKLPPKYTFSLIKKPEGTYLPIPIILNNHLIFCEINPQFPYFTLTLKDAESIGIKNPIEENSQYRGYCLDRIQIGKIPLEDVKIVIKKEIPISILGADILHRLKAIMENDTLIIE